ASGMLARLAAPAFAIAMMLGLGVRTFLPDLGTDRGVPALVDGVVVLVVAGVVQLGFTWGAAHLLGVREVARAVEPLLRRLPVR
ncbi:MAG: hypothetical protein ACRCXL_10380, partial [Dermatophilaceae bacterium]